MKTVAVFLAVAILTAGIAGASESIGTVTVYAGQYDRTDTPVSLAIDDIAAEMHKHLSLVEVGGSMPIACQVEAGKLWWVLPGKTLASQKRVFELIVGNVQQKDIVVVKADKDYLDICRGQVPVLRYNNAVVMPPKGKSDLYKRSGFIHPVYSPGGEILSQIHPADHIHHMGLWAPWTSTTRNGRHVDFWNLASGQGTVRFKEFASKISGPVFGGFTAVQEHVDLKDPAGETIVLNENLQVRVWNIGGDGFLVDYISTQRCVTDESLMLDAYRYGGFGFRATEKWKGDDRGYLTSEGKTIKDADGSTARWCAMSGPTGQGQSGIVFMGHPANRAHPEPIRIWGKDFNDSFFNFCPIKRKAWELKPGVDNILQYRMYIYDGKITTEKAEQLWHDLAYPPKTVLERK